MERTRITFERAAARPGELVRGVMMMELPIDMRAKRFDVRAEGVERVPLVISVGHLGEPADEEPRVFEFPLLLELLHAPEGFGRTQDGFIAMPEGVYFLGFTFRVPVERPAEAAPASTEVRVSVRLVDATGVEVETGAVLPAHTAVRDLPSVPEQARRLALL